VSADPALAWPDMLRAESSSGWRRARRITERSEGIAADANGNLWFKEARGNKIGRLTP
jgi:hypothetical protein